MESGTELGVKILWAIVVGFLVGVFARSVVPVSAYLSIFLIVLAAVLVAASGKDRRVQAAVLACALFTCSLGILRMNSAILRGNPELDVRIGQKVVLEGFVSDEPDVRENSVRITITATNLASSAAKVTATILATAPAHTNVAYGEHVRVKGEIRLPEAFDTGIGREFNYPGYLATQGISYELAYTEIAREEGFEGNIFKSLAIRAKQLFAFGLQLALPEPQSSLAAGITVGDKRGLGRELTQEFRTASLVHIIVLSGYNITVVITALFWALSRTPRYVRFGAGGIIAIFFAVITGGAATSVRAAIMAIIAMTGTLTHRIYRADRALGVVAVLMVVWNPYLLAFDPGFQLSFLATAGLIFFSPLAERWFQGIPVGLSVREILISTVSAQIAVLPLLLYESGQLSLVSLPANLLALIAVPYAMLASLIAAVGGLIAGPIVPIIALPAYILLSYIINVAHYLSSIPFAAASVPAFSAWLLVPVYTALFGYAIFQAKDKTPPGGGVLRNGD